MANTRSFPTGILFFGTVTNENKAQPVFPFLYDKTYVHTNENGSTITGGLRISTPSDYAANISLSGVTLSIGSVAVTGVTQTSIVGVPHVIVDSLPLITGNPTFNVGNLAPIPFSGNVNVLNNGGGGNAYTGSNLNAAPQPISGVVFVLNPSSSSSSFISGVVGITGTPNVTISNFPSIQNVTGYVVAVVTGSNTSVSNPVYIVGTSGITAISGFVTVLNPGASSSSTYLTGINGNNFVYIGYTGGNLIGVSGNFTSTPAAIQAISGFTTINNTLPINISGIVQTTAPSLTAVSGIVKIDSTIPLNITGNFGLTGSIQINSVGITGIVVTSGAQATFGFNITGFSVGQVQIPAGASAYSIALTSGTGFVGGILIPAPLSLGGGGYSSSFRLGSSINVGTSGGQFLVTWEI